MSLEQQPKLYLVHGWFQTDSDKKWGVFFVFFFPSALTAMIRRLTLTCLSHSLLQKSQMG